MKYEIYIFDDIKSPGFYKKAIAEYEKRLCRYCKISCRFIKKEKEWEKLMDNFPGGIVVLPGEASPTSEEFAARIGQWELSGKNRMVFLIAGDYRGYNGTHNNFSCLHLSDFTMDSAMTAMILYEQIYRGYRILHHHPYHK